MNEIDISKLSNLLDYIYNVNSWLIPPTGYVSNYTNEFEKLRDEKMLRPSDIDPFRYVINS